MIVDIQQITSLSEFDFDNFFLSSFERMEKNFLWPASIITYEQKKHVYNNQLLTAIDGTWPLKNDTDTFIMFITSIDGQAVEFAAGYLDAAGYLSLRWNLTTDGPSGNRNWRYTPEALQARKQFITDIGAIGVKEFTWVGSLLYRIHKVRSQTGNYTLEETPIVRDPDPFPGQQLVEFTIRFN